MSSLSPGSSYRTSIANYQNPYANDERFLAGAPEGYDMFDDGGWFRMQHDASWGAGDTRSWKDYWGGVPGTPPATPSAPPQGIGDPPPTTQTPPPARPPPPVQPPPRTVGPPGTYDFPPGLLAGRNYIGDISSGWGVGDRNRGTGLSAASKLTAAKW
jgi:hypothetical protein